LPWELLPWASLPDSFEGSSVLISDCLAASPVSHD